MGLTGPPSPETKQILINDLTKNAKIRSIAAYYHKLDENSRIKRKLFGGIEAEMIYSGSEADEISLRKCTSTIGGLKFAFDTWETYFVSNQVILQTYLVDEIFRNVVVNDYLFVDAMCGVGSFTLPFIDRAVQKEVSYNLLANDLNPEAVRYLLHNLTTNIPKTAMVAGNRQFPIGSTIQHAETLIRKMCYKSEKTVWVILAGIPGKTEEELLPMFFDRELYAKVGKVVVTVTSQRRRIVRKVLERASREWSSDVGYRFDEPIKHVCVNKEKIECHTITFMLN